MRARATGDSKERLARRVLGNTYFCNFYVKTLGFSRFQH